MFSVCTLMFYDGIMQVNVWQVRLRDVSNIS